jgi:hypothetical protein
MGERHSRETFERLNNLFTHSIKYTQQPLNHQAFIKHDIIIRALLISFNPDYTKIKKGVKHKIFPTCCDGAARSGQQCERVIQAYVLYGCARRCRASSSVRFTRVIHAGVSHGCSSVPGKALRIVTRLFHADAPVLLFRCCAGAVVPVIKRLFHAGVSCKLFAIASIV